MTNCDKDTLRCAPMPTVPRMPALSCGAHVLVLAPFEGVSVRSRRRGKKRGVERAEREAELRGPLDSAELIV